MAVGQTGESIAADYLQSLGYLLYDRNVRLGRDEIDLIVYDPLDKVIVFVEVKSRTRLDPDFPPECSITSGKKRRMHRSAQHWISEYAFEESYRIDVVTVVEGKVADHFKEITIEPIL